jgi:tetratricopeptide (TPR) repeat protein
VHAGEIEPDSIRLHELLAESYRDMGKSGAAETEYTVALNLNPRDFTALIGAAANYLQGSRTDLAFDMIQRALKEKPSDPEANYIAGEVLVAQHKYDEAESYLEAGLSAKPELIPRIHALLGRIYASRGNNERAIEELKIGIASDDDGSVYFQLGKLYQKTGQKELADTAFEQSRNHRRH